MRLRGMVVATVASLSACSSVGGALEAGDLVGARAQLEEGATARGWAGEHGWTALHYAVLKHDSEGGQDAVPVIKLLAANGCDVNAKDEWKQTPLHLASSELKLDCAAALVEAGADVNATDHSDYAPLHRAILKAKDRDADLAGLAKLFVDHGLDLKSKRRNQTLADWANYNHCFKTVEVLVNAGSAPPSAQPSTPSKPVDESPVTYILIDCNFVKNDRGDDTKKVASFSLILNAPYDATDSQLMAYLRRWGMTPSNPTPEFIRVKKGELEKTLLAAKGRYERDHCEIRNFMKIDYAKKVECSACQSVIEMHSQLCWKCSKCKKCCKCD